MRIIHFFLLGAVLCLGFAALTPTGLAAEPASIEINNVAYDTKEHIVAVDGVADNGLKAVIWEIWRVDCGGERASQLLFFGSIFLKDGEFHSSVKTLELKDGRYLVKVANYFGGTYATAEFSVPFTSGATIPAVKPVCGDAPAAADASVSLPEPKGNTFISAYTPEPASAPVLRFSRNPYLLLLMPMPLLSATPALFPELILSIFSNARR